MLLAGSSKGCIESWRSPWEWRLDAVFVGVVDGGKKYFYRIQEFLPWSEKKKRYVQILKVSVVIMVLPKLNLYCNEVEISIDGIKEQIVWGIFTL